MEVPTAAKDVLLHTFTVLMKKIVSVKDFTAPSAAFTVLMKKIVSFKDFTAPSAAKCFGVASVIVKQVVNAPIVKPMVDWGGSILSTINAPAFCVGMFALLVLWWFGGYVAGGAAGKMMTAPGQPGVKILRSVFESAPKAYFRNLRAL